MERAEGRHGWFFCVFWSSRGIPAANLVFYCLFDLVQVSLSYPLWHACSADAVSALHVYSSIDVFGEKEKDWETHVRELCGFSDNLHFPELETF